MRNPPLLEGRYTTACKGRGTSIHHRPSHPTSNTTPSSGRQGYEMFNDVCPPIIIDDDEGLPPGDQPVARNREVNSSFSYIQGRQDEFKLDSGKSVFKQKQRASGVLDTNPSEQKPLPSSLIQRSSSQSDAKSGPIVLTLTRDSSI